MHSLTHKGVIHLLNWLHFRARGWEQTDTECVYFSAATAIVYDMTLHTQRFFRGHSGTVKSIAVHHETGVVATGQARHAALPNS